MAVVVGVVVAVGVGVVVGVVVVVVVGVVVGVVVVVVVVVAVGVGVAVVVVVAVGVAIIMYIHRIVKPDPNGWILATYARWYALGVGFTAALCWLAIEKGWW